MDRVLNFLCCREGKKGVICPTIFQSIKDIKHDDMMRTFFLQRQGFTFFTLFPDVVESFYFLTFFRFIKMVRKKIFGRIFRGL